MLLQRHMSDDPRWWTSAADCWHPPEVQQMSTSMLSVSTSFMCSATAEIITRIKDETAFEIGPSHVQNAWSVKLPSVKQYKNKEKTLCTSRRMLQPNYSL